MEEKMKKMLFLMLFLLILGAVNVNSQVRIGGNGQPNTSAVLDLNATDATDSGTKGLALPRVALTDTNAYAPLAAHVKGLLVYNTASTGNVTPGVYYNTGTTWKRLVVSPVHTADIADSAITGDKLAGMGATEGDQLTFVSGKWVPKGPVSLSVFYADTTLTSGLPVGTRVTWHLTHKYPSGCGYDNSIYMGAYGITWPIITYHHTGAFNIELRAQANVGDTWRLYFACFK